MKLLGLRLRLRGYRLHAAANRFLEESAGMRFCLGQESEIRVFSNCRQVVTCCRRAVFQSPRDLIFLNELGHTNACPIAFVNMVPNGWCHRDLGAGIYQVPSGNFLIVHAGWEWLRLCESWGAVVSSFDGPFDENLTLFDTDETANRRLFELKLI